VENYGKPPIVEAILEFQFEQEIAYERVQKASAKFSRSYPISETEFEIQGNIELGSQRVDLNQRPVGVKLSSSDRAKLTLARVKSFSIAELAPYSGWDVFLQTAKTNWEIWRKAIGSQQISRIGMRYINRIDIPNDGKGIMPSRYVTMFPPKPGFGPDQIDFYTMQVQMPVGHDSLQVTINTATVASPIPNANSLLLDLDLYTTVDIPRREDHLWEKVGAMRVQKNAVFEACITDDSRELFRQ